MKSSYLDYDFEKSRDRLDEILKAEDCSYEEFDSIPSRDKLTYTNGFYVNCSALFVDIRKSSYLPDKYKRPTLAKIYKAFLSEAVAVVNSNTKCSEINIQGDCVWGVFDTTTLDDINNLFTTAYTLSSLVDVLNIKLEKYNIDPITVGIGISYGRALMLKAGYNGSGINDVIWMGDVVNEASKLCNYGNASYLDYEIMVSSVFYSNLNDHNKGLLSRNSQRQCYHGNIIRLDMNEWVNNNKPKKTSIWF